MGRKRQQQGDPSLVVGYVRVSTEDQQISPDAQIDAIERWCLDKGAELVACHQDVGVSGAARLDQRPALIEAVSAPRDYGAGVLLVAKLDRLARSVEQSTVIERLVRDEGAQLKSVDGVGNDDTPEGKLMRTMIAGFAEYERELIRARTKVALAQRRKNGERWCNSAPFGFTWREGQLVEDPGEQRTILEICELAADGCSRKEIAERLELDRGRHPPRGERWHVTTVQRILRACETRNSDA